MSVSLCPCHPQARPARAHSLATHPRAATHLPTALAFSRPAVRTSTPARSPAATQAARPATGEPPPPCFQCSRLPVTCQAPCQLATWGSLGKGRAPTTGRPFPFPPWSRLPAGPRAERGRVREWPPACLLGASPRRHTAGPVPARGTGAGVASASGPAPPLAVPAPSWPACRAPPFCLFGSTL